MDVLCERGNLKIYSRVQVLCFLALKESPPPRRFEENSARLLLCLCFVCKYWGVEYWAGGRGAKEWFGWVVWHSE